MARGSGFGRGKAVVAVASLMLLAGADAPPPTTRYIGLCEASAAAMLDATHFVVASDDFSKLLVYERGKPKATVGLTLADNLADVTDIEAAARIGDTIFWLTSHSLNKKLQKSYPKNFDKEKAGRKRLFATSVDGLDLRTVGSSPNDFRRLMLDALGLQDDAIGTFNIEGLAATTEGALLVGLRAPLAKGDGAHVVRIDGPQGLVGLAPAAATRIAKRYVLPLGGRGIRSIERFGTGAHAFLIVAGPSGDTENPAAALFWWDGQGETVTPGPAMPALPGITPEALIAWGPNDVQLLWDNEKTCEDKDRTDLSVDNSNYWFPSVDLRF